MQCKEEAESAGLRGCRTSVILASYHSPWPGQALGVSRWHAMRTSIPWRAATSARCANISMYVEPSSSGASHAHTATPCSAHHAVFGGSRVARRNISSWLNKSRIALKPCRRKNLQYHSKGCLSRPSGGPARPSVPTTLTPLMWKGAPLARITPLEVVKRMGGNGGGDGDGPAGLTGGSGEGGGNGGNGGHVSSAPRVHLPSPSLTQRRTLPGVAEIGM